MKERQMLASKLYVHPNYYKNLKTIIHFGRYKIGCFLADQLAQNVKLKILQNIAIQYSSKYYYLDYNPDF